MEPDDIFIIFYTLTTYLVEIRVEFVLLCHFFWTTLHMDYILLNCCSSPIFFILITLCTLLCALISTSLLSQFSKLYLTYCSIVDILELPMI